MLYNLKELWEKYLRKQAQEPVKFLIIRYAIIWVILCIVFTNERGLIYLKDQVDYFVLNNYSDIQDKLADLREVERKGVLGEGDTAVERYTQLAMGAYISDTFKTKTQTASEMEVRDDNLEAYAILVIKGDGEEKPNDY